MTDNPLAGSERKTILGVLDSFLLHRLEAIVIRLEAIASMSCSAPIHYILPSCQKLLGPLAAHLAQTSRSFFGATAVGFASRERRGSLPSDVES